MPPGPETSSGFRWWFALGEQIAAWCAVVGLWILVHAVTIIGGRILAGEDVGLSVVALTAGMAGVGGLLLVALWMGMFPVLGEIVMVEATVFAVIVATVRIWMMRCPRWDSREDWQPVRARLRTVE